MNWSYKVKDIRNAYLDHMNDFVKQEEYEKAMEVAENSKKWGQTYEIKQVLEETMRRYQRAKLLQKAEAALPEHEKQACYDEALAEVNRSTFGLQAGIFTRDLFKMFDAWDRLEVGGVVINDVPSYRVDNMPYGGVKDSGLGREGIKFAMEDMTEIRNLVIRRG